MVVMSETIDDFPLRAYDKLRYADTDKQGHVNNAVYSTFFETGRTEIFEGAHEAAEHRDTEFVIAQITIKFLRETLWPGIVDIGTRVKRVGSSSVIVEQAIFYQGQQCATAESVCVQINSGTRRPQPFDDRMRGYFTDLQPREDRAQQSGHGA